MRVPARHEAGVGSLRLFNPAPLLIAVALAIVCVSCALLTASRLVAGLQLKIAKLLRMKRGAGPNVALAFAQKVLDYDRKFAGGCNSGHVLAASCPDPQEKGPEWAWSAGCSPGRLDQHTAGMTATLLGNPAVLRRPRS